jgi:aspartate aminotransferase
MEAALRREGALRLDIGDPDFGTPPHIIEAAARAARDGFTHYGPSAGLPTLRAAIADKVSQRNRFPCTAEEAVVTVGGSGGLFVTFFVLLDPGDEVLIPDPGWPSYVPMALAVSAAPVRYRLDAACGFAPDPDELRCKIGPRTKAIVLNSPSNPTGAVFSAEAMAAVLALAAEKGLWVVSDECYDELVLDGVGTSPAALGERERIVSVFSFSKTYAMTGWRIGYAVAPPEVAALLARAQEAMVSCASTPVQKAAEAALAGPLEAVERMRATYRDRRDLVLAQLERHEIGFVRPSGAFYVMADVARVGELADAFASRLLEEAAVAVVPGSAFGEAGEGMVRISLAAAGETLRTGIERLAEVLNRPRAPA